jgi:D-alanyl-D-alanine carboxypeptidase
MGQSILLVDDCKLGRADQAGAMKAATTLAAVAGGITFLLAVQAAMPATAAASSDHRSPGQHILALARAEMAKDDLHATIVSVWRGQRNLVTAALGTSMTAVPATIPMRFRIGSVAFSYLSTLLLQLRDEGKLRLSDRLSRWLPNLPHAHQVTLAMLIESRSGYADYVSQPSFLRVLNAHPFLQWFPRQLIAIGTNPALFGKPGVFRYAHTNFVLLGEVLSKITGQPLARLFRRMILSPLGLTSVGISSRPGIGGPVLHAFVSQGGTYQESTFWNPSWTAGTGEIMTSDILDLARTAMGIGSGALLSNRSYRQQTAHITRVAPGVYFAMGMFIDHGWILQNPLFSGYQATMAYLPSRRVTIAVTTTVGPRSNPLVNYSTELAKTISKFLVPGDPITFSSKPQTG